MIRSTPTSEFSSDLTFIGLVRWQGLTGSSDGSSLWTCDNSANAPADFTITFCPDGSDYVGPTSASTEYDGDTATC